MTNDEAVQVMKDLFAKGNDYLTATQRDRPYDGQSQTDQGERGKQEVHGVTMRDVHDAFVIGAFQAGGFAFDFTEDYSRIYHGTIHDLPWDQMDPLAVIQNAMCELEKRMGIYPNLPRYRSKED